MNNQKGSATIILLVILVVVLAAVSVYFVFLKKPGEVAVSPTPTPTPTKTANSKPGEVAVSPTPTPTKTATPTPSPAANPTADWRVYANTQYGFEAKYPSNWYLEKRGDFDIVSNYEDSSQYDLGSVPADLESIFITKQDVSTNETYDSLKKSFGNLVAWNKFISQYNVEGRLYTTYSNDHPVGNHTGAVILDSKGHKITFSLGTSSEDIKDLLTQILSTFKFTK